MTTQTNTEEVYRIDFVKAGDIWIVSKFVKRDIDGQLRSICVNQEASKKPVGWDVEAAIKWCESEKWNVRRWVGGARAWKGEIEPVRTTGAIKKMRENLKAHPWPELNGTAYTLDLRYDL